MPDRKTSFYRNFFCIYFPLVLQNVITLSVNLADNIMLGAYSETALSGVAAANQIQFIYQQLLAALGDGLVIFCSQYWGKRATEPMKKISAAAMHLALGIAVILFSLISLFPYQAIHIFTTDEPIIREGMTYLNIIRFTYLFFAVTQILLATLRSTEVVKIALWLSVMTFFVNCSINYALIFGHFGAPRLGCACAAIGTLAARILETAVIILYLSRRSHTSPGLQLHIKDYLRTDRVLRNDYLKITLPILAVQGLWGLNTALQTVILGHMTAAAIAANSVASTLFLLAKSAAVGAASTASVTADTVPCITTVTSLPPSFFSHVTNSTSAVFNMMSSAVMAADVLGISMNPYDFPMKSHPHYPFLLPVPILRQSGQNARWSEGSSLRRCAASGLHVSQPALPVFLRCLLLPQLLPSQLPRLRAP